MRVALTGGATGIGAAVAAKLKAAGHHVTAFDISEPAGVDHWIQTDLSDPASIDAAVASADGPFDALINNAGLFTNETLHDLDSDRIRAQFEVNAIAPLMVTRELLPLMAEGTKIANITSRMGSIEDNTSGAYYGYRASKAAVNAIGKSLANDLKEHGVMVAQIHPGFVQTRMVGFNGDISPEQAAEGIAARIDDLTLETTGGFWHSNGQPLPW